MKFTKMQGIGNDYVYVNCFEETVADPERVSEIISDRHFGIGADGLVLIMPSDKADFNENVQCRRQRGKYVRKRHTLHRQVCL